MNLPVLGSPTGSRKSAASLSLARAACLGAFVVSLPAAGLAPTVARAQSERPEAYTFAFRDAEIAMVVQEVLGQAAVAYVIDPAVTGKISLRIEQRLTREQLVAALEAALGASGVAMVRNGDQLFITPQANAKSTARIRQGNSAAGGAGYEVVAVPLGYAQPSEVATAMESISSANTVLYANDKLGLLLLGGSGQQLQSALETLKVFDQSAFQDSKIRWFELSQAQATSVASELDRIIQSAGLVGMSVVPLKRLNGVIVFGRSPQALEEISKWVAKLDTAGRESTSTLWVYRPTNSSAEALARTLSGLLGRSTGQGLLPPTVGAGSAPQLAGAQSAPASAPSTLDTSAEGEDEVRISVDKEGNSLLFFAPTAKWVQIQRILSEIDRPQRQILIEASIVEVTLGKQFELGVDWSILDDELEISSVNNATGVIRPQFPGLSVTFLGNDIKAAVNALGSRSNIEVVSAPKIIALDNRTARLEVGDQVPIVTQASQSTTTSDPALISTVEYRSTGVILTVTPRITGQDQLVLDVVQEVSSVARTNTSGIDSPTIQQRRFESALILQNGGTVALGGLISTNRSNGNSGVPGLTDIPYLGSLFGSQRQEKSRSELIVLLSATIIGDRASADRAMADLAADMHELQSRGLIPSSAQ